MLPLIARRADVWHGFGSANAIERKSRLLDDHAEKAGRDPASIRRATSLSISEPWDEVRRNAEALVRVGVSYLTVDWPSQGMQRLDEFASKVMPEIKSLQI
jgi:alkanesulfonate monooxygenase SsuD/methylene tetrahydromethanopterin reductase-like flavin-dependent oxidoreductase (luciferase family)